MLNKLSESIALKLNHEFGDDYKIYTESVKQGLKEPCFFIFLLTSSQRQVIGKRYFREHPFDIHYFPKSKEDKNEEILDVLDRLNDALEYITMDGDLLRGTNIHHEVIDDVLHFFVNYNLHVYKEKDTADFMESLQIGSGLSKG
ncbi:phage tail terminator family protein [Paenibacillus lentus]|uniref:Phage protein n=1 Tax=Paenibacillus lentus TaxID=1338368 RepID=A0A3Q8S397_9BACL|nr:hypothetical protein [Paenibacillus lentus]AZK44776.1 hypothetical protein EIM92_00010 [Paenibacillus lentus]